jgi:hypothetical protein
MTLAEVTYFNGRRRSAVWVLLGRERLWVWTWWRWLTGERGCLVGTLVRRRRWERLDELLGEVLDDGR